MNSEKQKGISLKLVNRIMITVTIVIAFLLFLSILQVTEYYGQMKDATQMYVDSQKDAMDLRLGSDYLTEQVRNYAVTGDREFLDNYFEEAQVTKRRNRAVESIREVLDDSPAYASLNEALDFSNELMNVEYESFLLMLDVTKAEKTDYPEVLRSMDLSEEDRLLSDADKREKAIDLVFNDTYQDYKQKIYEGVQICTEELSHYTEYAQNESMDLLNQKLQQQYLLIAVLLCATIVAVLVIRYTVVLPLQRNAKQMQEDEFLQVGGVNELKMLQTSYNEIFSRISHDRQKLSYEATHDALTGLYNRAAYDQNILDLKDQEICFLMIDVDDFKGINDTRGHDVGDLVLQKVADTLKHSFRNEDMIFRLGGDEFVVIMMNMHEGLKDLVKRKVEMIRKKLNETDGNVPAVTLSIGAAFSGKDNSTGSIAKDADLALYEVKKKGKGQMRFFEGAVSENG